MKVKCTILSLLLVLTFQSPNAHAEGGGMSPKAKAFLTVAGYGAGGGALLGLASMAFGTSARAVAMGASLGLYAGLLFGTYVIVSHQQQQAGYTDPESSYEAEGDEYYDTDDSSNPPPGPQPGTSIRSRFSMGERLADGDRYRSFETKKLNSLPPFQMDIIKFSF